MLVDLHIHTFYSDGTMSPKEVVNKAKEKNVKIISITDHNKINAWEELSKLAKENDIMPIKGVEINVKYNDKIVHLLAYSFDDTQNLINIINKADLEMQKMSDDLIRKISQTNKTISMEDYLGYNYDNKLGGWKGIHYLYDRGITSKLFDGFKYYNEYGCGYEQYDFPDLEEACKAINNASGYSVLAHPGEYFKNIPKDQLIKELEILRVLGISGIECYYPTHDQLMTDTCIEFCEKYNMIITSGSDDHGEFGKEAKVLDQSMGCMNISLDSLNINSLFRF